MKLVLCIINDRDKTQLCNALLESSFEFTTMNSSGGFLRKSNTTILIGIQEERFPELREIIQENCKPREEAVNNIPLGATPAEMLMQTSMSVRVGGATLFVLPVEKFEHF